MAVNTPWCPRCGAWRGYVAPLCKGCEVINVTLNTEFPPVEGTDVRARSERMRELVQARFVKISEMRTDREAFTQALEEMVEQNVEILKAVAMDWMRMRPESRRVRFSNMFALEVITVARQALETVGALSLELSQYTENKARHEELMQQVAYGMQTVEKFVNPTPNDPEDPPNEEENLDDLPPGATSN